MYAYIFIVAYVISSKEEPGVKEDHPVRPCLPDCDSITQAEANVYGKRS